MAAIHNPPENARYADDNLFVLTDTIFVDNYDETFRICLLGDFNARTANLPDSEQDDAFEKLLDMCKHLGFNNVNG